jgi:hypothetical protein
MYLVIEYEDYRKENYIIIHGVTSDLAKAKDAIYHVIEPKVTKINEGDEKYPGKFHCPVSVKNDNEYVHLEPRNRNKIIEQFRIAYVDITSILDKTLGDVFEMLDERVPKRLSLPSSEIVTKDIFLRLINEKYINKEFLGKFLDVDYETSTTAYAIVECEEL